jgi:alpha-galactosidase
MHVDEAKNKAILYVYDIHPRFREKLSKVKLQGLDPHKTYSVKEINLMPGAKSFLPENGKNFTGDYLMKIGLEAMTTNELNSRIIEIVAE